MEALAMAPTRFGATLGAERPTTARHRTTKVAQGTPTGRIATLPLPPEKDAVIAAARDALRERGDDNAESVAKRQLGLLVLPLNLVRLDQENGHTVEDHPEAVVFEFNRIDAEGNLTSSISSAVSLYGFTSEMAEITAASWRSLSRPQVVVQARCVAPRPVRKQNAPW